eukprot:c8679_g1_i1.p2 GENE.c8679_g1_i1~~c8679_g1_i1.p2  ORF type:complete len:319 (-),score=80.09 c8679_g1_i1:1320-2276(-)
MSNSAERGKAFLRDLKLGDVAKWRYGGDAATKPLQSIKTSATVQEALALMSSHNVLSVPVWDETKTEFVVFLSVIDVLRFAVEPPAGAQDLTVQDILSQIGDEDETQVDVWDASSSASMVMEWFALGIHRLLVKDEGSSDSEHAVRIISQSDMLRYVFEHAEELSTLMSETVEESHMLDPDAPSIAGAKLPPATLEISAWEGFQKLFNQRTSALPLVDGEGRFVAALSVSDLRGITSEEISHLHRPVTEFLQLRHSMTPFTCSLTHSLHQVLEIAVRNNAHRVWVVDNDGKLLGVVTLADLLSKFAPFDYKLLHSKNI